MERVLVAAVIVVVAAIVAFVARRRRQTDAPTSASLSGQRGHVPAQLDRAEFASPGTPWLVAVFTSATCDSCAAVSSKAEVLASAEVAVEIVEFQRDRERHRRYRIDAVPLVVVADADGVVRHHTLGPVGAADLWAAVATARGD